MAKTKTNKKAQKIDYSWTYHYKDSNGHKKEKHKSGRWQLRVDYIITSDRIKIKPYVVITGDGFEEARSCTIKCEYKELKKSKKNATTNWKNTWVRKTKSSTHKLKSEGKHKVFFADSKGNAQLLSFKTYKIKISAKIGTKVSSTEIFGTKKPPKPQLVEAGNKKKGTYKQYGLEHNVSEPYIWNIYFEYEPKGDTNDYAAPVDDWYVFRQADSVSANWDQIGHRRTNHDVNGFREKFQNEPAQLEAGHRYKWKVIFTNDAGAGPARVYPVQTGNSLENVTNAKGKSSTPIITQNDRFKEWAYTPPPQLGSVNALWYPTKVRLSWERDPIKAYTGLYRGYFFQVIKDKDIDKVTGLQNTDWSWASRTTDKGTSKYLTESSKFDHVSDFERTLTANIPLKENHRYMLRIVPFNYDKGAKPSSITTSGAHIQKAVPSEATEVIYYKPCAPDSVSAVYNEDGFIDVTIKYGSASGGSVNCARIFRKYRFSDNTTSDWIECYYDGSTPPAEDNEGIELNRNGKTEVFTDVVFVPTEYDGKSVTGVKYSVKLGVNEDTALAPSGDDRFSSSTVMDSWVSNLQKPDKPSLLFPENNKAYPETTESVTFTWAHNSKDGTGQQAAKLDIFVFASSVSEIPSDFFSYPIWNSSHPARNTIDVEGDSAFYTKSLAESVYKITDIDTSAKTVTYTETTFSPNDIIQWRVATKGSYTDYSNFSTEERRFNIFGAPSISLSVKTPNNIDAYYNIDRTELESDWLWVYSDGGLSPARRSVSKQYKIVGWCDNIGNYATGEDHSGYSYLGKDYLWDGNSYVNVEYEVDVLTQIPATVSWEYTDLSGTLQALNLYLVYGDTVVESYSVNLEEDTEHTFAYLFDNDELYSVVAEATSSTTLTTTEEVTFLVSYITVNLRRTLAVTADFEESTGFATVTLAEEIDEGSTDDNSDLDVVDGESTVLRAGTAFDLYFNHTYSDGYLVIKSLLDKSLSDITIGCTVNSPNLLSLFPDDELYPNELLYPQKAVNTKDMATEHILYEGYPDPENEYVYLFASVPTEKGIMYAPTERTNVVIKLNYLTGEYIYDDLEEETAVTFPIKGTIYDSFDELDQPENIEIEDEVPVDVYLYRYYRDEKTYIGHFTPNFDDDETIVATIVDRFCPINREFEYQLVQVTDSGHIAYSSVAIQFDTLYWYCYWGPTYDNVAKARWNPSGSASYSRPERQSVRYSGRKYPVVYDSNAIDETYNFNVELIEDPYMHDMLGDDETAIETIDLYRNLMLDGGVGFWKSFEGDVYFATFDFSYSVDYKDKVKKYPCSLSVTRIEGNEVF